VCPSSALWVRRRAAAETPKTAEISSSAAPCYGERCIQVRPRGTAGIDTATRLSCHARALYDAAASRIGCLLQNIGHSQALCKCRDTQGIHVVLPA
jgi:hypothetical protein